MKKLLCTLLILAASSVSVEAKQLTKEQLPAKLLTHFTKKHPKTSNLIITEQKHFGQSLYKLSFTEELMLKVPDTETGKLKQEMAREDTTIFYRSGGQFFVNAQKIEAFNVIPGIVIDGLKTAFPDYKITAALMIPNPNGPGDEYEITITSAGQNWNVALNNKGVIITKDNLAEPAAAGETKPAAKEADKDKKPAEAPKK
jgi:hypothetical protein